MLRHIRHKMLVMNITNLLYTPRNGLWRLIALGMIVMSVGGGWAVQAQSTETPTPTPTATPTATPTPDVLRVWQLPTTVNDQGTPEPSQWVGIAYEANAGDVAIMVFLAAIFFTLVALSLIWLLPRDKEQSS